MPWWATLILTIFGILTPILWGWYVQTNRKEKKVKIKKELKHFKKIMFFLSRVIYLSIRDKKYSDIEIQHFSKTIKQVDVHREKRCVDELVNLRFFIYKFQLKGFSKLHDALNKLEVKITNDTVCNLIICYLRLIHYPKQVCTSELGDNKHYLSDSNINNKINLKKIMQDILKNKLYKKHRPHKYWQKTCQNV